MLPPAAMTKTVREPVEARCRHDGVPGCAGQAYAVASAALLVG